MHANDDYARSQGCYLDIEAAERVRAFFRMLRHTKGRDFAGKPFELLQWQWKRIVLPLFGWKRADGRRRFRRAYVEVPKKNGKSTLLAGLALYLAVADGEPAAEVYIAAADRRQASIIFNESLAMVSASPAICRRFDAIPSKKKLQYLRDRSFIEALSADAHTKEGLDASAVIFDELHAQQTRKLWDTLAYATAARSQPLSIAITTAGSDKDSVCYEQHRYARNILDGTALDSAYFAFIAAADPDDDWTNPAVWAKANPSLGVTIPLDTFEEDCRQAQLSPPKQAAFKRYRLDIWTADTARAIQDSVWMAGAEPFDVKELDGQECYVGIDLASSQDVNALVLYFPASHAVLPFFWVPVDACKERERLLKTRLEPWIEAGHITALPGAVVDDYTPIRATLDEAAKRYKLRGVAIDRWNAVAFAGSLKEEYDVKFFGQGYASFSGATKQFLALVVGQKFRHNGNPVLRWMAGNLAIDENAAGDQKPNKRRSLDKIDGIAALIMAIGKSLEPTETTESVYEKKGIAKI